MAVRVLNAETDGVTSSWTVPLDSGPAASREHATVIVKGTFPDQPDGGAVRVSVDAPDGRTQEQSITLFGVAVAEFTFTRYHDVDITSFMRAGDPANGITSNYTSDPGVGPPTALVIETRTPNMAEPAPLPAGGHIEVWVG